MIIFAVMKKVLEVILLSVVIVALVMGCGGMHRYDSRLVEADSIMWDAPDSALTVLSAIDSLGGEADRAYRDLLMTQARYKCYQEITASDDSAITSAMDYYRRQSGEREKLTRAYLYKGAVMEELGHVDSAMFYYKTAEVNADEKDYTNLGQINTRIGGLYLDYYADPQICYEKNNQALKYYKLTGNKPLQLICMLNMASCSGITRNDTSEKLLNHASILAIELRDSSNYYMCQELLCRQLSYKGKSIPKAKRIALHCLNDYRGYINHDLLLDLADIYAYSGMPDSAIYYLDMVTESAGITNPEQVQTRKYLILSRISRLEGDTALSSHYDMLSHQVSDSTSNNRHRYIIQEIENSFNSHQFDSNQSYVKRLRWVIIAISLIAVLLIMFLLTAYVRRMYRTKAIIRELHNVRADDYDYLLRQLDSKNDVIAQFLTNLVTLIKSIDGNDAHNSASKQAKRIKETIADVADDGFWCELKSYMDKKHNGLISKLAQTHNLTEKDEQFIELCLCGFSNVLITIIMGYSTKYISNKRKNLSEKLGIDLHFKSV